MNELTVQREPLYLRQIVRRCADAIKEAAYWLKLVKRPKSRTYRHAEENEMRIENWGISIIRDPFAATELQSYHLVGKVYGHPRYKDGDDIMTTAIVGVIDGRVVTKSGSEYELGEPHPDYEALFPNAKQRVLAQTIFRKVSPDELELDKK